MKHKRSQGSHAAESDYSQGHGSKSTRPALRLVFQRTDDAKSKIASDYNDIYIDEAA